MSDTSVSEVVTRPYLSPAATGSFSGEETVVESGSTLSLNLTKDADLTIAACADTGSFTIASQQALEVTITKQANLLTMHFALDERAQVQIAHADGSVTPFTTSLDIQGDLTVNLTTGTCSPCQVTYCGQSCGAVGCGSAGSQHGDLALNDADTAFSFGAPGATGFADAIIAGGAITSGDGATAVTNAHEGSAGAAAVIAGAHALEAAFPPHYGDPAQGVTPDDTHVLDTMGFAALAMIADPNDQAVADKAALAATAAGAQLAVDDGLAAYGLVAHPPPGSILLG